MVDVFLSAFSEIATLQHLSFLLVGVLLGLMVGVFPGLGGIAGLSLLMPFLYGLDTTSALALLIGLVAVIPTSDTFASVLMGIPGSSASQATVLDGFPLAKQGEAARALSAAFFSSLVGGIIGAIILTGFVLVARPLILAFGSAELFMLSLFGLSMVGVLAGRSLVKGLSACGIGLVIGSIGGAPATGEFRMVMGIDYLYDGIPLVIVGLGLFAVPEIVDLLRRDRPIAADMRLGSGWFAGVRDWWRNWFLSVRCSGLGAVIGAIPGLGGTVVDWIAYGHAVQSTKKEPRFGQGDIRGVIAPESANNAKEGGGLLPTLMFGIPGSGAMAIFLGGMVLLGIQPGPSMVTTNLDVTYTIIWSLALANILGAALCIALAIPISRLTLIPFQLLAPFMITVICFASFQATRILDDLVALLVIGLIGIYMRRFGWPRPALLIGFVMAPQAEAYLYQAVQFHGWAFLGRTGVLIILAITVVSLWIGMKARVDDGSGVAMKSTDPNAPAPGPVVALRERWPQLAFAALALALFIFAINDALRQSFLGQVFPLVVASVAAFFGAIVILQLLFSKDSAKVVYDQEEAPENASDQGVRSLWSGAFWIALLVALTALVGFFLAMLAFFLIYLPVRARTGPIKTLVLTAGAAAFVLLLANALNLNFPYGQLQEMVRLPWPLR
ncbi:MAG: tripartite tricarboxylate transporter permease [Salinarimonas sp.]